MKKNAEVRVKKLVPYNIIVEASAGDVVAINFVLKHYSGYIKKLSMRTFLMSMDSRIVMWTKHYGVDWKRS